MTMLTIILALALGYCIGSRKRLTKAERNKLRAERVVERAMRQWRANSRASA